MIVVAMNTTQGDCEYKCLEFARIEQQCDLDKMHSFTSDITHP